MSYKYSVKLKQQTPLIHFQHDETGACIRASELKPKFDKFLLKKAGTVSNSWFVEKENRAHDALDYKVKIMANGVAQKSKTIDEALELNGKSRDEQKAIKAKYKDDRINGMYFGNMSNNMEDVKKNYKESVFYSQGVTVEFVCFIPELMACIQKYFAEFIAVTNFGTRQSKGFGGFSVVGAAETMKYLDNDKYVYFYTEVQEDKDYNVKMSIADAIYSAMKGGKNYSTVRHNSSAYIKGYVQRQYLDDNGLSGTKSDKAFMKAEGFFPNPEKKDSDYMFVRALLGLADHYEFKDDERRGTVQILDKRAMGDKSDSAVVARYKSPITIKIVDRHIFFLFEDTFDEIKGKTFVFVSTRKSNKDNTLDCKKEIRVPDAFDRQKFMEGFINYFNTVKGNFRAIGAPYSAAAGAVLKKGGTKA